jgi:glucosylglycerate synthase
MERKIVSALPEEFLLPDDLLRQLMNVGEVDFLVGIASHDSTRATEEIIQAIEQSVQTHFVRERVVIVSTADGNKGADESQGEAANVGKKNGRPPGVTALRTIHTVTADLSGQRSPGYALRAILSAADLLRARACAVVSPTNFTPDAVATLLKPVYREKFDFVAPLYTRHKYQGLLARNLLYPMSKALFGCGIRELYSDEWGFSGRLASFCLNQDVWQEESIRNRPEAWMAISSMSADFRCCQAFLGEKTQTTSGPATDIVEVLRQTVGTLFWCMEHYEGLWLDAYKERPAPTFGPPQELTVEPMSMDRGMIFEMFRSGVKELEPVLSTILDPETHGEIKGLSSIEEGKFRFKTDLWVRTLYDFAASYHHDVMHRNHLVQALAPLYRGMTHSFLAEHADSSPSEIEAENEMLCEEFELQKPYLQERWKAKVEAKS